MVLRQQRAYWATTLDPYAEVPKFLNLVYLSPLCMTMRSFFDVVSHEAATKRRRWKGVLFWQTRPNGYPSLSTSKRVSISPSGAEVVRGVQNEEMTHGPSESATDSSEIVLCLLCSVSGLRFAEGTLIVERYSSSRLFMTSRTLFRRRARSKGSPP